MFVFLKYMLDGKGSSDKQAWWQPALNVFLRLSGWILAPLILGITLGKWLDRKYGSEPWLFLATVGVAFIVSMFGLVKNAMEEFRKIEKNSSSKINNSNPQIDSNASNEARKDLKK